MKHLGLMLCTVAIAAWAGCSDDGGNKDASSEPYCTPGALRCDPAGTQTLQRCREDGSGWDDYLDCSLCNDAICYPLLDAFD